MLQAMDHMEARCVFYVKVGRHNRLEQSKTCILTITLLGIVMLTVHRNLMVSMSFICIPHNDWIHSSPDISSFEQYCFNIYQK
jgi:hypothetical protein